MIRVTLLALAATALATGPGALAQTPSSQLVVYVDVDTARSLIQSANPGAAARAASALAPGRAQLASLQADLDAKVSQLQRNMQGWSQAQITTAQTTIAALQKQIKTLDANLREDAQTAQQQMDYDANAKILQAITDYTKQNPRGLLVRHGSGVNEDEIVVVSPAFELATAFAEMAKSGPGAFAPAHPGRAPVIKYVDMTRFMDSTGQNAAYRAEGDQMRAAIAAKINSRRGEIQRLNSGAAAGQTQQALVQAVVRISDLEKEIAKLETDGSSQLKQFHEDFIRDCRAEIAAYVASHPSAIAADVLRLEEKIDTMHFADPSLDVTATLASLMKPKTP